MCVYAVRPRERKREACLRSIDVLLFNQSNGNSRWMHTIYYNERAMDTWIECMNCEHSNFDRISCASAILTSNKWVCKLVWKTKTQSRRGDLPQQLITKSSLFLFVCAGCAQIEWKNWECSTVAGFLRKHLSHRDEIHVSTTHAYHLDLVNKLSLHTCIFDKYIQLYTNTNTWILRTLYPSWHILFSKQTQNFLIN